MNGSETTFVSSLVHAIGMGLIHAVWQVGLLGLILAFVLVVLPRHLPALRHAVALGTLVLMLVLVRYAQPQPVPST